MRFEVSIYLIINYPPDFPIRRSLFPVRFLRALFILVSNFYVKKIVKCLSSSDRADQTPGQQKLWPAGRGQSRALNK